MAMDKRRVVITGIGVVSPNGIGAEAFWRATRSGASGIDTISSFDPASLACRIAGEVKNFNIDQYVAGAEALG